MNRAFLICIVVPGCYCTGLAAAPQTSNDLAPRVRNIFQTRCASCHGPDLPKPKGRFGYVLDLKRLAANPEMVVPRKAEESELYQIIQRNEMPPSKPLNSEEKDTVRAWILGGAPPLPADAEGAAIGRVESEIPDDVRHILAWPGRFHLLFLHFPIAFLIAAAIAELAASRRSGSAPSVAVRTLVWCGAATAVPTAILGWCYALAGHGSGAPATLAWHRWVGTSAAAWAVATALLVERDARRGKRHAAAQLMIVIGALLVAVAAYFGASLVHGEIWLDW
jgi:mono/diheme cytochrome c family protein/uncharacterized membrane protein